MSSSSKVEVAASDPNKKKEIKEKEKMVVLKSSDGETFEVRETVALEKMVTVKHVIEDMNDHKSSCDQEEVSNMIPVLNVTGKTLAKVIEYCNKHAEPMINDNDNEKEEELKKKFDEEFVDVDQATLFDLILAANYLNIKSLLDLTCQTVANMMIGKTPEEIRDIFHIVNDYTPDEEDDIRTEHAWAFQDPMN